MDMQDWKKWLAALTSKTVLVDHLLNDAIARLTTPIPANQIVLREMVLPRIRDEDRADVLGRLLREANYQQEGETADTPEAVATLPGELKTLFKLRHQLAHTTPAFEPDPNRLRLTGFRNGVQVHHDLSLAHIETVDRNAWRLLIILDRIVVQGGGETTLDLSEIRQG